MKVLDLFSGIGGFSLGLERAGFNTVAFCEIEPNCQKVLKKHWPSVPIYEDVRNVTVEKLNSDGIFPDVITGGFPCQDISIAGKQAGIEGERSGLWSECARILGEFRPRYAIFENVTALLSGDRGKWFERVLWDISQVGYDAEWHCIPASAIGAVHHRDRVWIICYPHTNSESTIAQHDETPGLPKHGANTASIRKGRKANARVASFTNEMGSRIQQGRDNVAYPGSDGLQRRAQSNNDQCPSQTILTRSQITGACSQNRSNRGIWQSEPAVGRVANGIPRELDIYRGLIDEQSDSQKTDSEALRVIRWRLLRTMWQYRETAKASPELYAKRLHDSLPEVPHGDTHGGWYLGAWIEESQGLRDLWQAFYSKSFEEAQDLQQELLERIRKIERTKEVGPTKNRVDRLKGLGNSVVPQIPEIIGRAILEFEAR